MTQNTTGTAGIGGGPITDPTADPSPHPVGRIVQDQIQGAEGTGAGMAGDMGSIRRDLQSRTGGGVGLQHVDHSADPLYGQIVQGFEDWGRQARMVPEQFGAMLGQALAQWASMNGNGMATGIAVLHQFTAFLGTYGGAVDSALAGGSGFGNIAQQGKTLETTDAGTGGLATGSKGI